MAKFTFLDLQEDVRQLMLSEIEHDHKHEKFYISERLNEQGRASYKTYLVNAVTGGDEATLENMLDILTHFNEYDHSKGKPQKMPSNASTLLCQSEFNRYYIRAICLKAINSNSEKVEIYRARVSSWSRPESEQKIGTFLIPKDLLEDLRASVGKEPKLLPEINSGLCVKIPPSIDLDTFDQESN